MKRYSAPHSGLPYFLPRSKDRGVIPASASLRVLTLAPEGVVLPKNPMQRGRVRFEAMSLIKRPTESRREMLQRAAEIRNKLTLTDIPGYTHRENGQAVEVTSSRWFARMRLLLQEIGERLEARKQPFTYEVPIILPVQRRDDRPLDPTQHKQQWPAADIPRILKQLTDTVVIAPGAPARS